MNDSRRGTKRPLDEDGVEYADEMKDYEIEAAATSSSKHRRGEEEEPTSRDFFISLLRWAAFPESAAGRCWQEHNREFICCTQHYRLTDLFTQPSGSGCAQCGFVQTSPPMEPSPEQQDDYHRQRYPLLVPYKAGDAAGRKAMKALFDQARADAMQAKDSYEEAFAKDRNSGKLIPFHRDLQRCASHSQRVVISYRHFAWLVADAVRQSWKSAAATAPSTPHQAAPPDADSEMGFLETYAEDMREVYATDVSSALYTPGQMWCFQHRRLGLWLPSGHAPHRFESCGLCLCPVSQARAMAEQENDRKLKRVGHAL